VEATFLLSCGGGALLAIGYFLTALQAPPHQSVVKTPNTVASQLQPTDTNPQRQQGIT
jgi:hypothetical protein